MKTLLAILFLFFLTGPTALAEESMILPESPSPAAYRRAPLEQVYSAVAWPGYGIAARDTTKLGRTEKQILLVKRLAFSFDFATTARAVYPGSPLIERNPMNTLFGDQSRAGVLGSMTAWELGYSYVAASAPLWFGRGRASRLVKIVAIVGGGFLIEEHIRSGVCNMRLYNKASLTAADNCMLF